MRISDWSSDVCSSDLEKGWNHSLSAASSRLLRRRDRLLCAVVDVVGRRDRQAAGLQQRLALFDVGAFQAHDHRHLDVDFLDRGDDALRSEEHTSELQSLMRISYAVFCLKKKTRTQQQH